MLRPSPTILFFLLATIFLALVGQTSAAPVSTARGSSVTPGQDKQGGGGVFQGPRVVHTTKTTNTDLGPVTEDCEITLTPESNGLVREDRVCTVTLRPDGTVNVGNNGGSPNNTGSGSASDIGSSSTSDVGSSSTDSSGSSSTDVGQATASSSDNGAATTSSANSSQATTSSTGAASASATDSSSASSSGSAASSSSASSSASATSSASSSAATSSSAGGQSSSTPTTTAGGSADSAQVSATTLPSSTTPAQAEQSSPTSTAFSLPGQKLSVLPIGLGVFAGISVIALIVVGLVTYERTKYRKAFRQRKLAEQGQTPAYGGMAERPA